jgi:hypothetical protein
MSWAIAETSPAPSTHRQHVSVCIGASYLLDNPEVRHAMTKEEARDFIAFTTLLKARVDEKHRQETKGAADRAGELPTTALFDDILGL